MSGELAKYRSDGRFLRESVRDHVRARDPRACGASSPLVLARVPGMGPPPHVSRAPSSSIARSCFSLSRLIPLPAFALSFSPSLAHGRSLALFLPPLRRFLLSLVQSRALTCEVSRAGVPSYVLRHCAMGKGWRKGWRKRRNKESEREREKE